MPRLYSFDFDGTLVDPMANWPLYAPLARELQTIRDEGAHWAINTGRTVGQLEEGLRLHTFPILPDFIITEETALHRYRPGAEPEPAWDWNERRSAAFDDLIDRAGELFQSVESMIRHHTKARYFRNQSIPDEIIAVSVEEMDRITQWIDDEVEALKLDFVAYQRNSIYLRFGHKEFNKGSALRELATRLEIDTDDVFTVGDGHNDLPMLRTDVAACLGCPANSIPEVKDAVRKAGGYLARQNFAKGTLETLRFFR